MDAMMTLWATLATTGAGWAGHTPATLASHSAAAVIDGAQSGQQRLDATEGRQVAHEIGSVIWAAKTIDDVTSIIDGNLDNPELVSGAIKVSAALFNGEFAEIQTFRAFVDALLHKSHPYERRVAHGIEEGTRVIRALSKVFKSHQWERDEPSELTDYDVPMPMFQAMLGAERSVICLSALVDLAVHNYAAPRAWLLDRVIQTWIEGNRMYLHLAISFRGSEGVPADLLRNDYKIDMVSMTKAHNQELDIFEEFMLRA
jgi:hypothetical protein